MVALGQYLAFLPFTVGRVVRRGAGDKDLCFLDSSVLPTQAVKFHHRESLFCSPPLPRVLWAKMSYVFCSSPLPRVLWAKMSYVLIPPFLPSAGRQCQTWLGTGPWKLEKGHHPLRGLSHSNAGLTVVWSLPMGQVYLCRVTWPRGNSTHSMFNHDPFP